MKTSLVSCNELVNFAARNGISFQTMTCPMGCSAQWWCDTVGPSLYMHGMNKGLVFRRLYV